MRVLIGTNQLAGFTGSEVVALELAETFGDKGHECVLVVNAASRLLTEHSAARGVTVHQAEPLPRLEDFDLVWCLHHVFPLLLGDLSLRPRQDFPFVVSLHLSPYEPFEIPPPLTEELFASKILANSPETRAALARTMPERRDVEVFPNPAPKAYFARREAPPARLANLLVISNHLTVELAETLRRLGAAGVAVRHIGLAGERKRVTPEDILAADALVTIGKSVQYGLVSQTPVFCYDLFGGPGWLSEANLAHAELFNFSGRCTPRHRTAEQLVKELLDGFGETAAFASRLQHHDLQRFSLDAHVDRILRETAGRKPWSAAQGDAVTARYGELLRVRNLARLVRRESGHRWRLLEEYARLRDRAEALTTEPARWLPPLDETIFFPLAWFRGEEAPVPPAPPAAELRIAAELWNEVAALPADAGGGHAAERAAAGWMARGGGRILLELGDTPHGRLAPLITSTLAWEGGSPVVASETGDPGLLVSFDPGPAPAEFIIFIGVTVPSGEDSSGTEVQVFYRAAGQEGFDEAHSRRKPVHPGYNFLFFVLGPASLEGSLRIDPGHRPGTYRLSTVSVFRLGDPRDPVAAPYLYISDEPDFRHLADRERYRRLYEEVGTVEANRTVRWREEWMRHFSPATAASTILELGAHNGPNLLHYGALGHEVDGVELASTLVETFQRHLEAAPDAVKARVRMDQGWIEEYQPRRLYDHVLCTEILEHVADPVAVLKVARKALKPRGTAYITSPVTRWGNNTHVRGVAPGELRLWLEDAGLEAVRLFEEEGRVFCWARHPRPVSGPGSAPRVVGICRVRNEELIIADTIAHMEGICDGLIFYDDCSTDGTREVIRRASTRLLGLIEGDSWKPDRMQEETRHRRLLYDAARERDPDWIFYFDADERLDGAFGEFLRSPGAGEWDGIRIQLFDAYLSPQFSEPYLKGEPLDRLPRLFGPERRDILMAWRPGEKFVYDGVDLREPVVRGHARILFSEFRCKHFGKGISEAQWEETCRYYATHFPEPYRSKWEARKGKAMHVQSDHGTPLYRWDEVWKHGIKID